MYKLTPEETAKLQEMILEEEKRDSAQDLLELASILIEDEGNKDLLGALVEFIKIEVDGAISRVDIKLAHKTLKSVHSIRYRAKSENPWAAAYFNRLIKSISGPRYLRPFSNVLRTMDGADKVRVKLIWQFFLMLHSDALEALAPMLSQIRSLSVQKQFMKILEIMASRDLDLLERLIANQDEDIAQRLVFITGRIPGRKPVRILLKMTANASARVRRQAIKSLLTRDPASLQTIFPLIEDSSPDVRQALFDHLQQQKNEVGEKLLLRYLKKRRFAINSPQHLLACYRALGKCGSPKSIPFLKQLLFQRRWLHVFHGPIHRQGAVAALLELQTQETQTILAKASRSFFPTVRKAYKRGSEAIHC